mgnify:CR=1 FL=1
MNVIIQQYNHLSLMQTLELEARVCFTTNSKKMISNINAFMFKNILEELKIQYPLHVFYDQTVYCYDDDLRIIHNKGSSTTKYQKKSKIINHITDTTSKYLKIKWSLNIEEELKPQYISTKPTYIRKKKVHIFDILPDWQLYCIEASSDKKTYEIEIEKITNDPLTNDSINQVQFYIQNLFANRYENHIVHHYNSLFDPNKHVFHYAYWPILKPINLKYDMWKQMKDYNFLLKYDGERYLLLVYQNNIYMINETTVKRISTTCKLPDNTILDTEYIEDPKSAGGTFYVFDILFYDGKDVREKYLHERFDILKSLTFPRKCKLTTLFTSFNELSKYILPLKEGLDGIIFIPKNQPYKNNCTYKYKPANLLTIDFLIQKNQLYMETVEGLVLFHGDKKNPYNSESLFQCKFDYQDGDVIEFTYNKECKQFIALRKRSDKLKPNFIKVALDVWYDIFNEIDIISFIQNISI